MPTPDFPIRVPFDVLEALGKFTGHFWSDTLALEPFICEAIDNYMHPAPTAQEQSTPSTEAGYQWKQVFLPDGTRLRASFGGQHYFAQVIGEEIRCGEQAMSPSRFANLRGSGNRNAWKAIWLRLPGSDEWLRADVCRSARKMAIVRLLGAGAPAEHPHPERRRQPVDRRAASHTAPEQRSPELHIPRMASQGDSRHNLSAGPGELAAPPAMSNGGSHGNKGSGKGRHGKRRAAKRLGRKHR